MSKDEHSSQGNFHLSKWYLDHIGQGGEAMIFYAATLKWQGLQVSYTSWLHHHPAEGTRLRSRLRHVQMPVREGSLISWADPGFGVSGTWTSRSPMVEDRIFDSEEGYLDWHCYQPASDVRLTVNGKSLEGRGYAEQLIMTVPTWKIPMDELRWGRFGSDEDTLVWIELREKEKKQWLWHNGEKIADAVIEDDHIVIPERKLVLDLDRSVILESEKKILSVVEKIIRYIPGFNKAMPLSFLTAHATKWMSRGKLSVDGLGTGAGMAIHERVRFKDR